MRKSISIKKRLIVSLLTLIVITFLITISKNYVDTQKEIQGLMDAELSQSAHVLLVLSTHELHEQIAYIAQDGEENAGQASTQIHTHEHKYKQEIDFQIWTITNGHLAVRSEHMPDLTMIRETDVFHDREINGKRWRIYAIQNDEKTIQVQVAQQQITRDELSTSISQRLITLMSLVLPILAALIYITVDKAFRPLNKVADEISSRQSQNLEPISVENAPVETHAMIAALNDLFCRLSKAIENISIFASNAAHELRTPLSVQKIHAQIALQSNDEEARNESLNEIMNSIDRATISVEQLLTLSRLDPHGELGKDDTVDLRKITEDVMADLAPTAIEKDIDIGLEATGKHSMRGREGLISILVRNLVENAIRNTLEGGKIEVIVYKSDKRMLLRIDDEGPGILPEERENVFEQFFRLQNSDQYGTGLGLAMVKRIIEIHKADIKLGDSPLNGLRIEVSFKLDKNP